MKRKQMIIFGSAIGLAVSVGIAFATPGSGAFPIFLAFGRVSGPHPGIRVRPNAVGDVVHLRAIFNPGGYTGWHTHPGPGLVTVKAGTLTCYTNPNPACRPKVYHQGESFLDIPGLVHDCRNLTSGTTELNNAYFVPPGMRTLVDSPQPASDPDCEPTYVRGSGDGNDADFSDHVDDGSDRD